MLQARRGRGRILPATPNKPSDIHYSTLNSDPRVNYKLFKNLPHETLTLLINFFSLYFSHIHKCINQ